MKKKLLFFIAIFATTFTNAQPGTLDLSFNPNGEGLGYNSGANSTISCTSIQSDGKIIIGGLFTFYNGWPKKYIARLNANGTFDNTFNVSYNPDNSVRTISIQSDGKIIIGGDFTYGGIRNKIARLQTNGSLDQSFNPGTGINGNVSTTAIQSDGKIIIGGTFNLYNGTSRNNIARLNADGSLDSSFNPGIGANDYVTAASIQNNGKIIIAGNFTSYNGTTRNFIARLNADGSLDSSFSPATGANNTINTISIQSDGKVIIGGGFSSYNGTTRNFIARLNSDGSLDSSFNPGNGPNSTVYSISIQGDGKIIIGGNFVTYNGIARNYVARLNLDGSLDTTLNSNIQTGTTFSTSIQSDGKIIVGHIGVSYSLGGGFVSPFTDSPRSGVFRINTDGILDATFNSATESYGLLLTSLETASIQSDGKIVIGGNFTSYNGKTMNNIARLNFDGSLDQSFNSGRINGNVSTTAIQSDGKIIIGGNFNLCNVTSRNNIARLNANGSLDSSFNPGSGTTGSLEIILIQSDGKIIIGGNFGAYNGTTRRGIARLNINGSLDTTFNTIIDDDVTTIIIQSDGKIIIGGYFTSCNGYAKKGIARLNADGTLDNTFNSGIGLNSVGRLNNILVQSDGKILIGGNFTSYNGTARKNIARLNIDGSLDSSFNVGSGADNTIFNLSTQNNGKILIWGSFTSYNGIARNKIACLNNDGSLDLTFVSLGVVDNTQFVYKSTTQSDGKIIIGGTFTSYNGTSINRVARINGFGSLTNSIFEKGCVVIYPNPAQSIINISLNENFVLDKITIVDITGKIVLELTENLSTINVEKLAKGLYILTAYAGDKKYQEKFIKD